MEETQTTEDQSTTTETEPSSAEIADQQTDEAMDRILEENGFDVEPSSSTESDSDDSDEQAESDSETDDTQEESSESETDEDEFTQEQAIDALVAANYSMDDIRDLTDEQIMKIGARHYTPPETSEEASSETDEEAETDSDSQTETLTDEQVTEQIVAELVGGDFSAEEASSISKAISKAISLRGGSDAGMKQIDSKVAELTGLRGMIQVMSGELEKLSIADSRSQLVETYPQLSEQKNLDAVVKKASSFVKQTGSLHEALEMATLSLFGREQNTKIANHAKKRSNAKRSGTPNARTNRDGGRVSKDPVKDAALKIVQNNR